MLKSRIPTSSRTLVKRLKTPTRPSVTEHAFWPWTKLEIYFGIRFLPRRFEQICITFIEGSGSRVRFELNGVIGTFHRPHPQKEAKPYQVRDARAFLEKVGVLP